MSEPEAAAATGFGAWLHSVRSRLARRLAPERFRSSADYWQRRYAAGGNSGAGSYQHLAEFKAEVLNDFVARHRIDSVVEFGCGDGNQLRYASYPAYTGYDVSPAAIARCRELFVGDAGKQFFLLDDYDGRRFDLALSLDVIFHLVEDAVFADYMTRLFASANRYVVIYSSNTDELLSGKADHVRHRKFTGWVAAEQPDWQLVATVPNRYPYNGDYTRTSFSDFFFFERVAAGNAPPAR